MSFVLHNCILTTSNPGEYRGIQATSISHGGCVPKSVLDPRAIGWLWPISAYSRPGQLVVAVDAEKKRNA